MKNWKVFGNSIVDRDIHYIGDISLPEYPTDTDVLTSINNLVKVHSITKNSMVTSNNSKVNPTEGRIEVVEKGTGLLYYLLIQT